MSRPPGNSGSWWAHRWSWHPGSAYSLCGPERRRADKGGTGRHPGTPYHPWTASAASGRSDRRCSRTCTGPRAGPACPGCAAHRSRYRLPGWGTSRQWRAFCQYTTWLLLLSVGGRPAVECGFGTTMVATGFDADFNDSVSHITPEVIVVVRPLKHLEEPLCSWHLEFLW